MDPFDKRKEGEGIKNDQVVKSFRNWAIAQESKAERRGRLHGIRDADDDEEEDVVVVWGPALADTASLPPASILCQVFFYPII